MESHCMPQEAQLRALGGPLELGKGDGGREAREGRDVCIPTADLRCCIAETNTVL